MPFLSLPEKPISDIAHFQNGGLVLSDEILEILKLKFGHYYAPATFFA